MKGTYCLVMKLESDETIAIGKKTNCFTKGYYVYVGSALNNLEKRIVRHRSRDKKHFWHIDYFLERAEILGVKTIVSPKRLECSLSQSVKQLADSEPMKGFGSSDCRCGSHLYYFVGNPLENEDFMKLFVQG
jgi:sugar fermentation stimulation protein A